jgi:hypothetical protein
MEEVVKGDYMMVTYEGGGISSIGRLDWLHTRFIGRIN